MSFSLDECDWTLNQPLCEAHVKSSIHQPKFFGFGWTLGLQLASTRSIPSIPTSDLVVSHLEKAFFENFHHHLSCFKCGLLIENFEFISPNLSHGRVYKL